MECFEYKLSYGVMANCRKKSKSINIDILQSAALYEQVFVAASL